MQFNDALNRYIDQVGCTAKELSDVSGVSPAVISRYRSGERVPGAESPQLTAISAGIAVLSRKNPRDALSQETVHRAFLEAISGVVVDYGDFLYNLNALVETLGIANTELAQALLFDPSYISRILTGQRRPADMPQFLAVVSRYAAQRTTGHFETERLARLIGCTKADISDEESRTEAIESWLSSTEAPHAEA